MAHRRLRGRPRVTPSTLPPGCRRHGRCIQASVRRHGHPRYQSFPLNTKPADLIAWQKRTAAELDLRYGGPNGVTAGTFAADAKKYRRSVKALADYKGRERDIDSWVALFGNRRRHTITPAEIRAQRDAWLTVGPKMVQVKGQGRIAVDQPLAASTVNHRLRALENLFTVLDGKHAYNPVREVPEAREPDARPRALPYSLIDAILDAMPDRGQGLRDTRRSEVSKTKARLRLMAYAGLTHSQVAALLPEHFRTDPPEIYRSARGKGKGAGARWVPVPADAVVAMQAFADADAWGPFTRSSVHSSFQRACRNAFKALGIPEDKRPKGLNPYSLRHSYVTVVLKQTGDLTVAQALVQHASPATTRRYALGGVDEWLATAAAKVTGLRQGIAPGSSDTKNDQ